VPLMNRLLLLFAVLGLSVGCDQATKQIANATLKGEPMRSFLGDTFRLVWATNEGAFLSLGANLPPAMRFFVLTAAVGLLLLGIVIFTAVSSKLNSHQVSGYAMIAGGGLSNWVDRARHDGSVVDFLNLGIGRLRTGIFNVADLAILAGIGFLLFAGWKHDRDEKAKQKAAAPPAAPVP
jgi:signal peptidase II